MEQWSLYLYRCASWGGTLCGFGTCQTFSAGIRWFPMLQTNDKNLRMYLNILHLEGHVC
jgi:hypothetical protein